MLYSTKRIARRSVLVLACGLGCAHAPAPTNCGATIPRPSSEAIAELEARLDGARAAESWIAELDRALDAQDACRRAAGG